VNAWLPNAGIAEMDPGLRAGEQFRKQTQAALGLRLLEKAMGHGA